MARQFKIAPKVSVEYVAPAPVKRAPKAQPIPQIKRVTPPKINNGYAAWTDSNLIRTLTLSKPESCETRVINESMRIKADLRRLLLFARDCEQNLNLRAQELDVAVGNIKHAIDLIENAQYRIANEIERKARK